MAVCVIMLFLGVVFASTVFTRRPEAAASYRLDLFWSWKKVFLEGNRGLLLENILNVILFLPLGFLLPAARGRRLGVGWACFCGLMVSAAIEVCQLVLRRGLFEWDDMVHNSLGCIFGCALMNAVLIKLSDRRK